jgi:tRNA threonylcarbamoyladenosine biosynthesis protein TsaB
MSTWICISSDYNSIQLALCSAEKIVENHVIDKKDGNQRLLSDMDILLKKHNLAFSELRFIGINVGPAPYTGLRIAIATANGLHAATGIPLVPIDALKAFVLAYAPVDKNEVTIALLNAFNNDLFYATLCHDGSLETGYEKATTLLERLAKKFNTAKIHWVGNGVAESATDYPSIHLLAAYGWQQWLLHNTTNQASPLYLKTIA